MPYRELGKLVVALDETEIAALDEIERRARGNGVPDLVRLDRAGLREIEPNVEGVAALHSPRTAVVDYVAVCAALVEEVVAAGGAVELSATGHGARAGLGGGAARRRRAHVPLRPGDRLRRAVERLARPDGRRGRRPARSCCSAASTSVSTRQADLVRARLPRARPALPVPRRPPHPRRRRLRARRTERRAGPPARATAAATSSLADLRDIAAWPGALAARGRALAQRRSRRWPAPRRAASMPAAYAATSRRSSPMT